MAAADAAGLGREQGVAPPGGHRANPQHHLVPVPVRERLPLIVRRRPHRPIVCGRRSRVGGPLPLPRPLGRDAHTRCVGRRKRCHLAAAAAAKAVRGRRRQGGAGRMQVAADTVGVPIVRCTGGRSAHAVRVGNDLGMGGLHRAAEALDGRRGLGVAIPPRASLPWSSTGALEWHLGMTESSVAIPVCRTLTTAVGSTLHENADSSVDLTVATNNSAVLHSAGAIGDTLHGAAAVWL